MKKSAASCLPQGVGATVSIRGVVGASLLATWKSAASCLPQGVGATVGIRAVVGASLLATLLVACGTAPDNTLADARAALEAQHPAKAIELLKPYISAHAEDGVARALLAEALLDSGNLVEGRREIAEADRLRAPRNTLRVSECRVAAQTMTLDEAMGRCAAAQGETATERAALYLQGGLAQLAAQHPVVAIYEIQKALQERPAWLLALQTLAVAQTQAGDDTAAEQTLAAVFKLAANAPESFHLQGELAFLRGQYPAAATAFAKAAAAAISGLAKCVRAPGPCLPVKLRLEVETHRSPGATSSPLAPTHNAHPGSRHSKPADLKI